MKYRTKNIINISLIIIIFVAMLSYMIIVDGIDNIITVLKSVDVKFAIIGIAFIIIYWLLEAICLYIVEKKFYKTQSFFDSLKVSMIGQLFNCITPFSSGGQIVQAVAMKFEGKSVSKSATILLIKFIIYQATLVLYTLIVIILKYTYFENLVPNFIKLALLGFAVNLAVIIFLILIGINKNFVLKFVSAIYKFLNKIRLLKNVEDKIAKLQESVDNFSSNFKIMKKEKLMIFKLVILTVIQLTVFYAITYIVYRMFGQNKESIKTIISAQSFLSMVMAFVPIPGAGIAAEGGFNIIFSTFFSKETINMAILFWRLYTFYLPIIVGAIFMIKINKKNNILKKVEENE